VTLEDTSEEIKLIFNFYKNAIPYATTEEGFVKTMSNVRALGTLISLPGPDQSHLMTFPICACGL